MIYRQQSICEATDPLLYTNGDVCPGFGVNSTLGLKPYWIFHSLRDARCQQFIQATHTLFDAA